MNNFYFTFYYLGLHLSPTTLTSHAQYSSLIHQSYAFFSRYCLSPTTHFNPTNSVSTSPCCIRLRLSLTKATLVTYYSVRNTKPVSLQRHRDCRKSVSVYPEALGKPK